MFDVVAFGAGMIVGGVIASALWVVVVYELEQQKQKAIAAIINSVTTQVAAEISARAEAEEPEGVKKE